VTGVWADALGQEPLPPDQEGTGPASPDGLVSRSIPIQGRLTDAGGAPINGTKNITFTLYTASVGGTALCEDSDPVSVVNGLFATSMQYCTAANINGQGLWLGLWIRGEAAEMTPRQPIYPVPYAFSLVPGAEIGGVGAGDGSLYLRDATGVTVFGLTASNAILDVGGLGNAGDIYVRNVTDTITYRVDGASGDVRQSLAADGLVKAAVFAECGTGAAGITRSFNHVGFTMSIAQTAPGKCTIDFGFDVSARFVVATAASTVYARSVSYNAVAGDASKIYFYRWDTDGTDTGSTGYISVMVY
jgi:hypothetical protein